MIDAFPCGTTATISSCGLFIKTKFQMERVAAPRKLWVEIAEGMKWMWHQPFLRTMAFLNSGWSSLGFGFALVVIVLSQGQHLSPPYIGVLFAIGGVSSILGALVAPLIQICMVLLAMHFRRKFLL